MQTRSCELYFADLAKNKFTMKLTIESLKEVRSLLYSVRRKWYSIGIELNIKIGELETIKATYSDPGECLTEMLLVWLRSINPSPSWKALGNALKAEPVNEQKLGDTGKHV